MRIRAGHIFLAVLAVLVLLVIFLTAGVGKEGKVDLRTEGLSPPLHESLDRAPAIEVETRALDAGVVPRDRDTLTTVRVYNRGGSVLEIREVASSCPRCTVGYFLPGEHRIEPEHSSELQVVISPDGIAGFHSVKTLSLMSNDPRMPRLQLTVEATVDPEFALLPETFDFGEIEKGTPAVATVLFRTLMDEPLHLLDVRLNPDSDARETHQDIVFSVERVAETEWQTGGRPEYYIRGVLAPEMRAGAFSVPVFIHTDLNRFALYQARATGTVHAPYALELDQSGRGLVIRPQTPEAVVVVSAGEPIVVAEPESEQGLITASLQHLAPEQWQVRCAAQPGLGLGVHQDALLLEITCRDRVYKERIPIRVHALGESL